MPKFKPMSEAEKIRLMEQREQRDAERAYEQHTFAHVASQSRSQVR